VPRGRIPSAPWHLSARACSSAPGEALSGVGGVNIHAGPAIDGAARPRSATRPRATVASTSTVRSTCASASAATRRWSARVPVTRDLGWANRAACEDRVVARCTLDQTSGHALHGVTRRGCPPASEGHRSRTPRQLTRERCKARPRPTLRRDSYQSCRPDESPPASARSEWWGTEQRVVRRAERCVSSSVVSLGEKLARTLTRMLSAHRANEFFSARQEMVQVPSLLGPNQALFLRSLAVTGIYKPRGERFG
jgi:hypothetical protein